MTCLAMVVFDFATGGDRWQLRKVLAVSGDGFVFRISVLSYVT